MFALISLYRSNGKFTGLGFFIWWNKTKDNKTSAKLRKKASRTEPKKPLKPIIEFQQNVPCGGGLCHQFSFLQGMHKITNSYDLQTSVFTCEHQLSFRNFIEPVLYWSKRKQNSWICSFAYLHFLLHVSYNIEMCVTAASRPMLRTFTVFWMHDHTVEHGKYLLFYLSQVVHTNLLTSKC